VSGRGGWRRFGGGELRLDEEGLDLLSVEANKKCQRGRRREGEEIGERRRRGVHWIDGECSNSPRYWMFAGEKFHQPCGDLSKEKEGGKAEGVVYYL
jgi:hypothetical protein